jgi:hypothetical protein
MKSSNSWIRAIGLVALAVPLMANQSCDKPVAETRKLKLGVGSKTINSQTFQIPGRATVNFSVPISKQLQEAIQNSQDFYLVGGAPGFQDFGALAAGDDAPECMRNVPNYYINGDVTHFEFLSSLGIKFGYSPGGDLGGISVDGNIKVDTAQMGLTLGAYAPRSTNYKAIASALSNETKTKINANINFKGFEIGPEYYFQTPLEKVGRMAVEKALTKLKTKIMDSNDYVWEAQVLKDKDVAIIINAGKNAGLQAGDVLEIYNQIYEWEDNTRPCASPLLYHVDQRPGTPTAIITLAEGQVYDNYAVSTAQIQRPNFERAAIGATVRLKQFKTSADASLK